MHTAMLRKDIKKGISQSVFDGTNPKAVEKLLIQNNFSLIKSDILGTVSKALYIVAVKGPINE